MKRKLKQPKMKTVVITYWWQPYMYNLCGPSNTWYAPMKLSEKRPLLYKININKKIIEKYTMI